MKRFSRILVLTSLIIGATPLGIGATSFSKMVSFHNLPPPLLSGAAAQQTSVIPANSIQILKLPGPDGKTIEARFYGLERLPPASADFCPLLNQRLSEFRSLPARQSDAEQATEVKMIEGFVARACVDANDEENKPISDSERGRYAMYALNNMQWLDNKTAMDRP